MYRVQCYIPIGPVLNDDEEIEVHKSRSEAVAACNSMQAEQKDLIYRVERIIKNTSKKIPM